MLAVRWAMLAMVAKVVLGGTASAQQSNPAKQDAAPAPIGSATGRANGQSAEPSADPIVVISRPLPPKEQIKALSRAITPNVSEGPLPRFNASVCFGTAGLPRRALADIGYRLALDAELAGLKLAGDGCKPNVYVFFVDSVGDQVASLVRRRWWIFGDRSPTDIREITQERGPVRAWSNNEVRGADGRPIGADGVLSGVIGTHITPSIRRDTLAAIVLIERLALVGKSPDQIGDYVAMRALGGVRPPRTGSTETILSLFDDRVDAPPLQMTAFDRGYLRGLYYPRNVEFAAVTRDRIARSIVKAKEAELTHASKPAP